MPNTISYDETGLTVTLTLPDDDRAILNAIIALQRDCAQYLLEAANFDLAEQRQQLRLTQYDYNGDHVDYNTAAAEALAKITYELCGDGHFDDDFLDAALIATGAQPDNENGDRRYYRSIRSLLAILLSDADFVQALDTAGLGTDIFEIAYTDELN